MSKRSEAIVAASETLRRTRAEMGAALRRDPDYEAKQEANFAAWDAWEAALALPADADPPPASVVERERALVRRGTACHGPLSDETCDRLIAHVDEDHPRPEPAEPKPVPSGTLVDWGWRFLRAHRDAEPDATTPKEWEAQRIGMALARVGPPPTEPAAPDLPSGHSAILRALAEMARHCCPESGPHNREEAERAHDHLSALVQPAKREMDALRDKARAADAILAEAGPAPTRPESAAERDAEVSGARRALLWRLVRRHS